MNDADAPFQYAINNNRRNIDDDIPVFRADFHARSAHRAARFQYLHMHAFPFGDVGGRRFADDVFLCQTGEPCIRRVDQNTVPIFIDDGNRLFRRIDDRFEHHADFF